VVELPAAVLAANTSGVGSRSVTVPILLVANGNQNALSSTVDFDPTLLTWTGVILGRGAGSGTLIFNASQATNGFLSLAVALPAGSDFTAGTQEVAEVTFTAASLSSGASTTVSFGNQMMKSLVVDANGDPVPASFVSGIVTIAPTPIAGDVWPRPDGDEQVTVSDWVVEGLYVAGLEYPTNAAEFERADCAPRGTGGDGAITIIDWVQVGRYMAGLDPLTIAGTNTGSLPAIAGALGQRNPSHAPLSDDQSQSRQLQVQNAVILRGRTGTVSVTLDALGNENALGFSLSFDPSVLVYTGASRGSGANGVSFNLNANQAASGRLGFALALQPGAHFASGSQQIATVNFSVPPTASGNYPVALASQPVACQMSDANALALTSVDYANGMVSIPGSPTLRAALSGQTIQLSWPLWATHFLLQQADGQWSSRMTWSNVETAPTATSDAYRVTLPLGAANRFFRLLQQ
jgi:hypothetical protein